MQRDIVRDGKSERLWIFVGLEFMSDEKNKKCNREKMNNIYVNKECDSMKIRRLHAQGINLKYSCKQIMTLCTSHDPLYPTFPRLPRFSLIGYSTLQQRVPMKLEASVVSDALTSPFVTSTTE